jgi:hypothetical protein
LLSFVVVVRWQVDGMKFFVVEFCLVVIFRSLSL